MKKILLFLILWGLVSVPQSEAALGFGRKTVKLGANSGVDVGDATINNAAGAAAVNIQDGGNTITVDGTITADLSATDNAVLDQIELNTDPLLVVGGGTEATAQRVTIANDSTGLISVDDNSAALSIDFSGTQPTAVTRDSAYALDAVGLPLLGIFDDTSPDTVAEGDAVSLRTDNTGIQYQKITDGTDTALVDGSGNLMTDLGMKIAGEDITNDFLKVGCGGTSVADVNGAAGGGLQILAAGAAGVKNRIWKLVISADTTQSYTISDGFGLYYLVAGGNIVLDYGGVGKLQTTAATAITITSGAAANIGVLVLYTQE